MNGPSNYPLDWPTGWPRTSPFDRIRGQFKVTPSKAMQELGWEVERLGGANVVVSSNVPIRRDGMPYADASRRIIYDPGVAVYFDRGGTPMCFACDRYDAPWKNVRAISKTLEAIRAIERHGATDMMERALTAFEALPPPVDCWSVLGLQPGANEQEIRTAYRAKAKEIHSDHGGSDTAMADLNAARDTALQATQTATP